MRILKEESDYSVTVSVRDVQRAEALLKDNRISFRRDYSDEFIIDEADIADALDLLREVGIEIVDTEYDFDESSKTKTHTLKANVVVPGTAVLLEKGDKVRVIKKEAMAPRNAEDAADALTQYLQELGVYIKGGFIYEPGNVVSFEVRNPAKLDRVWDDALGYMRELGFRGDITWDQDNEDIVRISMNRKRESVKTESRLTIQEAAEVFIETLQKNGIQVTNKDVVYASDEQATFFIEDLRKLDRAWDDIVDEIYDRYPTLNVMWDQDNDEGMIILSL